MKKTSQIAILLLSILCLSNSAFSQTTKKNDVKKQANAEQKDSEDDEEQKNDDEEPATANRKKGNKNMKAGVEGGFNFAGLSYDGGNSTTKAGIRAGGLLEFKLSDRVHLQPGFYYAMNGSADFGAFGGSKVSLNTVEVPVNAIYKFGKTGRNHIFIGLGLCYGYNFSGIGSPGKNKLDIGSELTDNLKASNISLSFTGGYEMASGLFFRLGILPGLTDLQPSTGGSIKSFTFNLQVGYFFGKH